MGPLEPPPAGVLHVPSPRRYVVALGVPVALRVLTVCACESSTTDGPVAVPPRSPVSLSPPVVTEVESGSVYVPGGVEQVSAPAAEMSETYCPALHAVGSLASCVAVVAAETVPVTPC